MTETLGPSAAFGANLVTAAEDRGDGDEPKANEPKAVVREWLDMAKRQPINACHVLRHPPISPGELDAIESILALVSRLEETIRADGEALKPFAEALDTYPPGFDHPGYDSEPVSDYTAGHRITKQHLRRARARLSARQGGGE